ncbi:MAG: DUF4215 domain-containing protein [Deltaproteobacteria bacterium]|jgi:hypothetical protein|nr:DUF4215 domain-containing protein [Deltaproteobacteria bacterium]
MGTLEAPTTRHRSGTFAVAGLLLTLVAPSCLVDFSVYEPLGDGVDLCGNGKVDRGESCDPGQETADCDDDCTGPACGDGNYNASAGESCDDGNDQGGDACDANCEPTAYDLLDEIGEYASEGAFLRPSVGVTQVDGEPHFIATWVERGSGKRQVAMQVVRRNGEPVGNKIVLSQTGDASCSSIASNAGGRSVVTWVTENPRGSNQHETHYSVIEPGGQPRAGGELNIPDSEGATFEGCPEVAAAPSGEFCIIWRREDGHERTYCLDDGANAAGAPQSHGSSVSGSITISWGARAIWGMPEGFMASWFDETSERLVAQELDLLGVAVGTAFDVVTIPDDSYVGNGFAVGTDGAFFAAGGISSTFTGTEAKTRFLFQRFNGPDNPDGAAVLAAEAHDTDFGGRLVGSPSGEFLALWSAFDLGSSSGCTLWARKHQASGQPAAGAEGEPFQLVPGAPSKCGLHPEGAVTVDGDVMIVWSLWDTDGGPMRLQGIIFRDYFSDPE